MNDLPEVLLNVWNFLFIGLSFIGIFFSIKLIAGSQLNDRPSKSLGLYLLLQSAALLESCLFWTNYLYRIPDVFGATSLFPLLYGPLLLIYFDSVFEEPKPLARYGLHFLPFLVVLALKMPFYLSPGEVKILHPEQVPLSYFVVPHIDYAEIIKVVHLSIYGYILLKRIRSYPSIGYMRPWAKWILIFFIAFIVLTILYWLMVVTLGYILLADYFISLSACGSIVLFAWFSDSYKRLKEGQPIMASLLPQLKEEVTDDETIKYRNSGLPDSLAKKLAEELGLLMSREQLYKENDLKLETLAEKLKTNRHFVSQVINQYYQTNFFDFININRIEEAKRLLVSESDTNIIEIAYTVGYNNKATFNTAFKRITGVTPTEYRRQNRRA